MTFYCDEGVDREVVQRLRSDGYAVSYVAELSPSVSDEVVLGEANRLGAILVTMDKDFGELVFRLGRLTTGIFLIRLHDLTAQQRAQAVSAAVAQHRNELPGAFAVLSSSKLRIRRMDGRSTPSP